MIRSEKVTYFYSFIIFILLLFVTTGITVLYPTTFNVLINILLPIMVLIKLRAVLEPFAIVKVATLIVGRTLIPLTIVGAFPIEWFLVVTIYLFRINILEIILMDVSKKYVKNAVLGLVVLASTWLFYIEWQGFYYTYTGSGLLWFIVGYTVWIWLFVANHLNKQSLPTYYAGVLLCPMLALLINPGLWLIFRATSLTQAATLHISWENNLLPSIKTKYIRFGHLINNVASNSALKSWLLYFSAACIAMAVIIHWFW
ncbi:MAG: hypothetical protein K0Q74_454 [Gammaproteobacteria bacterium]|jgi:hypothetical protein|nr:hypothetical protein [Gammaproteobacteria bacterium]